MGVTSLPRTLAQLLAAAGEIGIDPFTNLIIGQIGTAGTAVTGQHYEDVQALTNTEIETLFGTASELTGRILRARVNNNGNFPIWVIALDPDGGAVDATLDITVVGTATEDGTITMAVIDAELYTITVDIVSGDDLDAIAGKIKVAIDALVRLPATSGTVTIGVFTLTANDGGTIPNKFTVKVIGSLPAGVTSVTVGQFSGGTTDPATTTIFDNVQAQRFHSISWPWENDFAVVKALLEARNVFNNSVLHGVAFIGFDGTEAEITAKVNGGTPLNSPNLLFVGNRQLSSESVIVTPADWRCVEFMTIEALRQTPGVSIGRFVTVTAANDVIGGPGLASLGLYNTPMALTALGDSNLLFNGTEQETLKDDGFTIIGINESNTSSIMGEVVSTYKFNFIGNPDVSFKYLNYIRTGYLALEVFYRTLKSDYSQFRLTGGDVVAGSAMTNKEQIEAKYMEIYQLLSGSGYTLTQAGIAAEKAFFAGLTITTDIADGLVTSFGILPIVTQVREINITFQLAFTVGG